MTRECMGGPFDGDIVPDYGPGWIDMLVVAELVVALDIDIVPLPGSTRPRTVRYHGCGNGHYHHDPE